LANRVFLGCGLVAFFGESILRVYDDWDVDGPGIAMAESATIMTDGEYKVSQALLREFPDLKLEASGLGRIDISNPDVLTEEGIPLLVRLSEEQGVIMSMDTGPLTRRMMKCAKRNGFQSAVVSLQYEPASYREERVRLRDEQRPENPDYLHGQCHILALALHRVSGLPIEGAVAFDHDINQWALVHAWVTWDGVEEMILHADGVENVDAVLTEFPYGDEATVTRFTPERLLRMGEGRKHDKAEVEAKIEAAMPLARQLFEAAENGLPVDVTP